MKLNNKCDLNSVKLNGWAVPLYHMAHGMLHVTSAWNIVRDFNNAAPRPLECIWWRQFTVQWGDCKKSRVVHLNVTTIIIIIAKYIPMSVCTYPCMDVCMFVCIYFQLKYVWAYIHTHTHTHARIHTHSHTFKHVIWCEHSGSSLQDV